MTKEVFSFRTKILQILTEIKEQQAISNCLQKTILDIDEAALYTKYKKAYIYKLSHNGEIPTHHSKTGGKLFFKRTELEEWMTSNKKLDLKSIENSFFSDNIAS